MVEDYPPDSGVEYTNGSEEDRESDSDSTAETFQGAVESQEAANLMTLRVLESDLKRESCSGRVDMGV